MQFKRHKLYTKSGNGEGGMKQVEKENPEKFKSKEEKDFQSKCAHILN